MGIENFGYKGKRVLVVGGATGMGAATAKGAAELGADVIVMDVAEISYPTRQSIKVDLRDRASVDRALEQITEPVHAVFCCAGVADGTRGLMLINFISQRHLLDGLLAKNLLGRGSSISMISSVGGLGWEKMIPTLLEFINSGDWQAQADWIAAHENTDSYGFSKQVMNCFIACKAMSLAQRGVRINGIMPGPTDTPLAQANADIWLTFGADYRKSIGRGPMTPEEMANTLLFLSSNAASGITGVSMLVDGGHVSSMMTGSYADPIAAYVLQS
jgi:NAD(P)-dependent dehydrogenase (short-subunit alcohol dehydrogenase family)